MSAITQLQTYGGPGRRYGSFARPVFVRKTLVLAAAQRLTWSLAADVVATVPQPADGTKTFTLEV